MIRRLAPVIAALAAAGLAFGSAGAQEAPTEGTWRHGLSLMGQPSYPPGFPHFKYVNPKAPKGGPVRFGVQGTFDNFNLVVAGIKGELEGGIGLLYDTLMTQSYDEVGTGYGLVAEAVRYPADYSSATYRLRAEAKFHDGKPIRVDDVIFSFDTLKTHSALYGFYYKNVAKVEQTGEREVTFTFNETGNRELPQIVSEFPILPKHWWEGTTPDGRKRDVTQTTLEPPLGSGAYRLKRFEAGRTAVYERVPDHWARDLNVNVGKSNFGEIRYDYFRDSAVLLEAFKGDQYDFRSENVARNWATAYDIPAVREGRVVKEEFPERSSGVMQAFIFNLRREKFKDERVRRAFSFAFNFEDINQTIFYGLYKRIDSYFFGTELASSGLPQGRELAILEAIRDKVPASVFTTAYANPVNGTPEAVRNNLREAVRLLQEAGYELRGRQMVNKTTGEPFVTEYLTYDSTFERYALPYKQALERIGITMNVRVVDPAQFQNRLRSFDYEMSGVSWSQSLSPGNEQRDFWGSAAAERPGSRNYPGIRNPAVDELIEKIVFARDRDELVATTRALDRVLLHNHYVVPQWGSGVTRTVRWNRFGRPPQMPRYAAPAFPSIWWYDEALAAKTGGNR